MKLDEDRVDWIIATYSKKGNKNLERMLESVKKFDAGFPYKIIIRSGAKTRIKHINDALKYDVESRYYLVTDDDIEIVQDNWLKDLMEVMLNKANLCGCVGPMQLTADQKFIEHAGVHLNVNTCVLRGLGEPNDGRYETIERVWQFGGACGLYDRTVAGYWPEEIYPKHGGWDDIDFQATHFANGFKIWYNGKVKIIHEKGRDDEKKGKKYDMGTACNTVNLGTYFKRWGVM